MSSEIEVLFLQEKKGKSKCGQKKRVKLGYARNFLFPQGIAVPVTKENEQVVERIKRQAEKELVKKRAEAESIKKLIENKEITFKMAVHDKGKLYGSITPLDVHKELHRLYNVDIDKTALMMPEHIREVGEHTIQVESVDGVIFSIKCVILSEEKTGEKEKKERKSKKSQNS